MPTDAELEAEKALRCLYIAVEEHVAKDVGQKVNEAFNVLRARIAELEAELARYEDAYDCTDEAHGPWCRQWRRLEAENARLLPLLPAAELIHEETGTLRGKRLHAGPMLEPSQRAVLQLRKALDAARGATDAD